MSVFFSYGANVATQDLDIKSNAQPLVSIVIPCLNEEATLGTVLREATQAFRESAFSFEIIVADNGSTDHSRQIAEEYNVRIVPVLDKGYGAALLGGFAVARGSVILFGDADATYDFAQGPSLVEHLLNSNCAMVIGTRIRGDIESGAMPHLHRYLGTPALTRLINLLFDARISDCNSGFRAFYRDHLTRWRANSHGMEFASELIVSCLKVGDKIREAPITLRRDDRERTPHLSTWRDGMRHLLFILSRAPHAFTYTGFALLAASLALALPCIMLGPVHLGRVSIFDFHSLILATLAGFLGTQFASYGLLLDANSVKPLRINGWLRSVNEVRLLKIMTALAALIIVFVAFIVFTWCQHGFNNLHYLRASLSLLYVTVVIGNLGLGIFLYQLHKRV